MPRNDGYDAQFEFEEAQRIASENHDPTVEPYASMKRDAILALMLEAEDDDLERWAMLEQFLRDKMTRRELQTNNRAKLLAAFLFETWDAQGAEQLKYLTELAGGIATMIAEDMPPVGPPEEVN